MILKKSLPHSFPALFRVSLTVAALASFFLPSVFAGAAEGRGWHSAPKVARVGALALTACLGACTHVIKQEDHRPRVARSFEQRNVDAVNQAIGADTSQDPYLWTVKGGKNIALSSGPGKNEILKIQDPDYPEGLPVQAWLSPRSLFGPKESKLVIFLNGTFGAGNSGFARSTAKLVKWGEDGNTSHFISFPNPLSHEALKAGKKGFLDVPGEAVSTLRMIHEVIRQIGEDRITNVELVGLSYGGTLSAAVAALDAQSSHPVIGKLLMLSPIEDMGFAVPELDRLMGESKDTWEQTKNEGFIRKSLGILFTKTVGGLAKVISPSEGKGLIAWKAFHDNAAKSLELDPESDEAKKLRFVDFIERTSPEGTRYLRDTAKNKLKHWLSILQAHQKNFSIVTSADDFLNRPHAWESLIYVRDTLIFPQGGHMGIYGLPEFKQLLQDFL